MGLNPDSSPFQASPTSFTARAKANAYANTNATVLASDTTSLTSSPTPISTASTSNLMSASASPPKRPTWQNRNSISENSLLYGASINTSPSPMRRSSLERLQKASRVKNSNILALEQKQEYDPTRVHYIERPLAKVQANAFACTAIRANFENTNQLRSGERRPIHQRSQSTAAGPRPHGHVRGAASMSSLSTARNSTQQPQATSSSSSSSKASATMPDSILGSPPVAASTPEARSPIGSNTPRRDQSPIKSSLSTTRFKSSFNEETGQWTLEDIGNPHRTLHRHAKSVTFDNAPPQVNEYEMATPDLSAIDTESNEGSYVDDDDDDYDDQMYRHDDPEDSFDASLEDTDKTPVVPPGSDGWHAGSQSPPTPRAEEGHNPYEYGSNHFSAAAAAGRQLQQRTDSGTTDHRPLPPLPGREINHAQPSSSLNAPMSPTSDRNSSAHRSLPAPPSHRSSDIHNSSVIGHSKMPLEERLKLMMLSDDGKSAAEQQRERRLRRAGGRDKVETPESDALQSAPESPNHVDIKAAAAATAALSSASMASPPVEESAPEPALDSEKEEEEDENEDEEDPSEAHLSPALMADDHDVEEEISEMPDDSFDHDSSMSESVVHESIEHGSAESSMIDHSGMSDMTDSELTETINGVDTLAPPAPGRSSTGPARESLTPTPQTVPAAAPASSTESMSSSERSSSPMLEDPRDDESLDDHHDTSDGDHDHYEESHDDYHDEHLEPEHNGDQPHEARRPNFSYEDSEYESGSEENVDISVLSDYDLPPLTRESIMRGVDNDKPPTRGSDYNFSSPPPSSSPYRPTTSHSAQFSVDAESNAIAEESSMLYDDEEEGGSVIIRRDLAELVTDDEMTEAENSVVIHRNGVYDMYTDDSYAETDGGDFTGAECDTTSQFSSHVDSDKSVVTRETSNTGLTSMLTPTQTEIDLCQPKLALNAPLLPRPDDPLEAAPRVETAAAAVAAVETQAQPPNQGQRVRTPPRTLSKPEYDGTGWGEPSVYETSAYTNDEHEQDRPSSPESVIHHPIDDGSVFEEGEITEQEYHAYNEDDDITPEPEMPIIEEPSIPERQATIKASGSTLKTRPSATPADIAAMREQRRIVSREIPVPDVPQISDTDRERLSKMLNVEQDLAGTEKGKTGDYLERHPSFKKRSLTLNLDTGLSLDKDFDRVMENQKVAFENRLRQMRFPYPSLVSSGTRRRRTSRLSSTRRSSGLSKRGRMSSSEVTTTRKSSRQASGSTDKNNSTSRTAYRADLPHSSTFANLSVSYPKRGYLMRQNTKLVSASDKDNEAESWKTRSAGNSPTKADNRPQSWGVVEPWNAKRQRSLRSRAMVTAATGAVPPMPGQESNAQASLNPLAEEESELATEEAGERGRLFVKVMGVKDLDLPIPKNERTWFSLTLDNGVHCVTTAWLELARNAPIGQEFELVVPNDLEFQLTLNVKLDRPVQRAPAPIVPVRMTKAKTSTFSRVFASPKKRKEMEARMREEEERFMREQQEAQAKQQRSIAPTAWDLLSPLAADDGSFARSYVCLKDHENRCFGRPYLAEVACFNEWAKEEANFACSVKSKRGNTGVVRRAPYKIGKLELQLLFVPRPKGSSDEDMPKSMNSCIREMKAAEERLATCFEGYLSQQGGDCPYWRRRYFKLAGTKLTAFHEATRQPRATINLANAKRLIDDRRSLVEKEITGKGGRRRRSAFAEEEDGYMFVEEGFRIRFNNGEVIDFYADTAMEKEAWIRALVEIIGRPDTGAEDDGVAPKRSKWCELVLKREDAVRRRANEGRHHVHARNKSVM
ncbi:hypothetical protein TD95_002313 [Thielaviopsis punctulata]|uniref:PH domain-containing protein n=1 Tax=Thielaviopsis punctulata TaxID=72032 RepID=A0A0F4ZC53_9PEZI|nr:hypothetical protein TD95_002313 [Thielaviopsis punctulata]